MASTEVKSKRLFNFKYKRELNLIKEEQKDVEHKLKDTAPTPLN